jgi:hypothetical protein
MTATMPETEEPVLGGMVPEINSDPAFLEAMFGNYGIWDHYRKVVQANCEEMIRAEFAGRNEKITESRIEALGRLHPNYLSFLADGLNGRQQREQNVFDSLRGA